MEQQPQIVEENVEKKKSMMSAIALASAIATSSGMNAGQAEAAETTSPEEGTHARRGRR